jgi:hypothetical protein
VMWRYDDDIWRVVCGSGDRSEGVLSKPAGGFVRQ